MTTKDTIDVIRTLINIAYEYPETADKALGFVRDFVGTGAPSLVSPEPTIDEMVLLRTQGKILESEQPINADFHGRKNNQSSDDCHSQW
jgi:hypothetical protein